MKINSDLTKRETKSCKNILEKGWQKSANTREIFQDLQFFTMPRKISMYIPLRN